MTRLSNLQTYIYQYMSYPLAVIINNVKHDHESVIIDARFVIMANDTNEYHSLPESETDQSVLC